MMKHLSIVLYNPNLFAITAYNKNSFALTVKNTFAYNWDMESIIRYWDRLHHRLSKRLFNSKAIFFEQFLFKYPFALRDIIYFGILYFFIRRMYLIIGYLYIILFD